MNNFKIKKATNFKISENMDTDEFQTLRKI